MAKATYDRDHLLPTGYRALAVAVLATGLEDAVKGDPGAREWLASRSFEHWCDWCDWNPDYLRRQIAPLLPATRPRRPRVGGNKAGSGRQFTAEELARAVELHDGGHSWAVAARALGTNFTTLCTALKRAGIQTSYRTDRQDQRRLINKEE